MIEERMADRFRAAVADEPPLGFDPDEVVSRAGRERRRRRAVAGSALATGGLAVTTAVLVASTGSDVQTIGPGAGPTGWLAPAPGGASSAPLRPSLPPRTKPKAPSADVPGSFPGSDAAVAKLRQVIPQVLAEKVTNLAFTHPDGGDLMVHQTGRLIGGAYLATGTSHQYIQVSISHDRDTLDLSADPAAGGGWGPPLRQSTLPDGSQLRVYGQNESGMQNLSVLHFRPDGVIVHVDATMKPEPGRSGLQVSEEVLTAIATDPRLTF
ncbi:hypothetical protein [Actinophytocola sp.]|uniref:hypothetical protein n=1 Tax=Actinophytocola sp. TaxID=1872138 RepID=UPI002D7EA110|nr:hypothetical protein [Actinophytocola sp.]HET9142163.1 hypothetical protein [Actinophytocola sp.]